MAKNCLKCSLPINTEQSSLCCGSCRCSEVHTSCIHTVEQAEFSGANKEKWKCPPCKTKDSAQNSCDTCNNCVTKLDELVLKINVLQEEQKSIVSSIINSCNDTIGEYEDSINNLTGMLSSLELQLDSLDNDDAGKEDDEKQVTSLEEHSSSID